MTSNLTKRSAGGLLAVAALALMTGVAFAQDAGVAVDAAKAAAAAVPPAPKPNNGDTAWLLISTVLVLMMSIPGLALFYGGLVRTKNMLSVLTQVFMIVSMAGILWCLYGYSIALMV